MHLGSIDNAIRKTQSLCLISMHIDIKGQSESVQSSHLEAIAACFTNPVDVIKVVSCVSVRWCNLFSLTSGNDGTCFPLKPPKLTQGLSEIIFRHGQTQPSGLSISFFSRSKCIKMAEQSMAINFG